MRCLFTAPAITEIYTLSLHDALPISLKGMVAQQPVPPTMPRILAEVKNEINSAEGHGCDLLAAPQVASNLCHPLDRKSTRLNSSHRTISYAVFCLKKKNTHKQTQPNT